MRRIALTVQYDGTDYAGFQRQRQARTIQGELEEALSALLQHQVRITAAGRTDAGVHAMGQVIALQTDNPIPVENLLRAANEALPVSITVAECSEVAEDFHPRYSAEGKLYSYRILNRPLPSPFINRYAWHVREPLDEDAMQEAARTLVGTHDFAAFATAGGAAQSTVREIYRLSVEREGELIETRIGGTGFLYMMVRNIMGTLVAVGRGELTSADVEQILQGRDRAEAPPPAPPQGLCLVRVEY